MSDGPEEQVYLKSPTLEHLHVAARGEGFRSRVYDFARSLYDACDIDGDGVLTKDEVEFGEMIAGEEPHPSASQAARASPRQRHRRQQGVAHRAENMVPQPIALLQLVGSPQPMDVSQPIDPSEPHRRSPWDHRRPLHRRRSWHRHRSWHRYRSWHRRSRWDHGIVRIAAAHRIMRSSPPTGSPPPKGSPPPLGSPDPSGRRGR